jgi:hypothetical protein
LKPLLLVLALGAMALSVGASSTPAADPCPQAPTPAAKGKVQVVPDSAQLCPLPPEVYVSANPSTITAGQSATVTWNSVNADSCGAWNGDSRLAGSAVVSPTTTTDYWVYCSSAISTIGNFARVTVNPAGGGGPPPPPPPPPNPVDNAAFVTQSVPTSLNTGQVAAVSVTMTNTGNTTWSTAGGYKLGSQNPENGTTWGLNRVALPGNVIPSQTVTFSFNITAPATAGTYNFQWRIVREGIAWIGPLTPNVAITVNTAAPPPPPPAAAQCADGRDNDGDTKVDMADPGCTGASDNDETDPPELRDYALLPEYGAPTSDVSSDPMWTEDFGRITCKRSRGHVTWSTLWGQRLWTMNQVVTWCWRGIQITSVSRNR